MSGLRELFLPDPATALVAGAAGLLLGAASAAGVAWAHAERNVSTPDTRKLFHFLIFTGALAAQLLWRTPGTSAYGTAVAGVVLTAVVRGDGDPVFEALARPADAPRRALFVVVPLVATAAGGVLSNVIAGPFALVGYLVTGWGDAIAEPVGVRWGRHPYRVPSLGGVPAQRSLEGSAAVLVAGTLSAWIALRLLGFGGTEAGVVAGACGAVATLVEAVSHHGTDNLTLQVAGSVTPLLLLDV